MRIMLICESFGKLRMDFGELNRAVSLSNPFAYSCDLHIIRIKIRMESMIEDYHFGSINVRGETYYQDVQIFPSGKTPLDSEHPTGQVKSWWRKTSHEVEVEDIKEALEQAPEIIVFGTGSPGMMEVLDETKKEIFSRNIELVIEPTKKAIEKFNELKNKGRKVIGLFHLTC